MRRTLIPVILAAITVAHVAAAQETPAPRHEHDGHDEQDAPPEPASPPSPWAEGVPKDAQDNAIAIFEEGNLSFEESRYGGALLKYQEAVKLWDHPAIRFNMAVCLIRLKNSVEAYENLVLALRYGKAPLADGLFAEGQNYLALLTENLAQFTITNQHADAVVTLDGQELLSGRGTKTVMLKPGKHQVVASKAGFATFNQTVTLVAGQPTSLETTLERLSIGGTDTKYETRWPQWLPWSVAGAGAIIAGIGIPLQLRAQDNFDVYDAAVAMCDRDGCFPEQLEAMSPGALDKKDRAELQNGLAVSAFVIGGAAAAAGLAMVVFNRPHAVTVVPAASDDGAGIVVTGSF